MKVVKSLSNLKNEVNKVFQRSKRENRNGKKYGIIALLRNRCIMTGIKQKTIWQQYDENEYHMVGIARDEPRRYNGWLNEKTQSILLTLGITEKSAMEICRNNNLLSPVYNGIIKRDGCFFCPNASKKERDFLHKEHPELVEKIYDIIRMTEYPMSEMQNSWINDYIENGNKLTDIQNAK